MKSHSQRIIIGQQSFTVLFPDLLRPLTDAERAGLKADIQARGAVIVPVIVDDELGVIDGANRLCIANELKLEEVPIEMRPGLSDQEKHELAVSLNEHRRHLTAGDRKELAQRMRADGKSYREIGGRLGTSQVQAMRDCEGVTSVTPEITGRDGKTYPATRPTVVRVQSPDEAVVASGLLDKLEKVPTGSVDLKDLEYQDFKEKRAAIPEDRRVKPDERPSVRWSRLFHDIYQQLNSIRDAGGIIALTKRWTPSGRADLMTEMRAVSKALQETLKELEKGQ
jgi:ParB-like chromosome segregation protein Spo0J